MWALFQRHRHPEDHPVTRRYVVTDDGYRLWRSSEDCPHTNENACATCDFDGYFEAKYPENPWAPWQEEVTS